MAQLQEDVLEEFERDVLGLRDPLVPATRNSEPCAVAAREVSEPASFRVMADDSSYPEGWNEVRGALQRGYRFKDFAEAIAFVNRLAEAAEEADHHPDMAVSWNAVTVRWWTHTKRAITDRDVAMARRTDELAR
jgi:4a-hydroxytetrahydrobiopterin dehydratase